MADLVDVRDEKRSAEKTRRAVDFAGQMETGDTVATCTVTAQDSAAVDVSANLISTPSASGTKVLWTYLAWGSVSATYYVRVVATTTNGDILPAVVGLFISGL